MAALTRLLPATLFGRLAWLLCAAVLASHVLALTMMFELGPPMDAGAHGVPGGPPPHPPPPEMAIWAMPRLWLDIGVRLSALVLAV